MKKKSVDSTKVCRFESLEDRRCCAAVSSGWDGPGQGTANLTYYVGTVPSNLSRPVVEAAIETALNAWSQVAGVRFTKTSTPSQLRSLDFNFRQIDGGGGTLAQAYLPVDVNSGRLAGDVTFDIAEKWEVGNALRSSAFDLVEVAVHEIGHALGLEHSSASQSVMQASVGPDEYFTQLSNADKTAILALYAPSNSTSTNTPSTSSSTPSSSAPGTSTPSTNTPTSGGNSIRPNPHYGYPSDWSGFRRFARSWIESWRFSRSEISGLNSRDVSDTDSTETSKSNCSIAIGTLALRLYDLRT